jgi:hypothetical protein
MYISHKLEIAVLRGLCDAQSQLTQAQFNTSRLRKSPYESLGSLEDPTRILGSNRPRTSPSSLRVAYALSHVIDMYIGNAYGVQDYAVMQSIALSAGPSRYPQ